MENEVWITSPLLPCYDMCKNYVIACTNDPVQVNAMCNFTDGPDAKFSKETPCTGFPYTVEGPCDAAPGRTGPASFAVLVVLSACVAAFGALL